MPQTSTAGKKTDEIETPEDLLDFVPSPKKRDVSGFTEEFTYVILSHIGLVVVYITSVETGLSGYANDLRQAIKLKNPNQDQCPYLEFSEVEKRDPINEICPGLWGPYSRVNDKEEVIQEVQTNFRSPRKSSGAEAKTPASYPATCFLLCPNRSGPKRAFSVASVEDQVQKVADYCNKVYVNNQRKYQTYNKLTPKTPQQRSFGLARQPNRTDAHHSHLPLNKFITRYHAVEFLCYAYNCDNDFYRMKTTIAQRLLHPPHSFEEKRLGYPTDQF